MLDRKTFEAYDWASTPLGPMETWPKQLNFLCDILLCSEQPMFLLWGDEAAFIFNAPYHALWEDVSLSNLGRPIEEVSGPLWANFAPLVERAFKESFVRTSAEVQGPPGHEPRYFDFSYTPIYDYDDPDKVVAALSISNDVTERVLSAASIKQEREVLALTVENVTEGVALIERDFSLVLWNEPFRLHFGYGPDQIKHGMNAAQLIHESAKRGDLGPGDPGEIVASLVNAITGKAQGTLELQRTDGRVLHLLRRAMSGGRQLLVSRDITDERQAARLKDELVSTVSHELRTPLTAIAGALGIVCAGAAGPLPEKAARLVQIAQRNSERLTALVNDLLDVDKLQSGHVEYHLEPVDLVELVHCSVEQNQPFAVASGVTLNEDVPASPVIVTADRNRLLQVLANLLSNAAKFSPPEEQVTVRLTRDRENARLSVIDHGIGVAEDFRSQLFQRFRQHDASSSRVQAGTGLGLVITKSIVEQLGGSIIFEPTLPKGATFHVDFPLAAEDRD